MVDETFDISNTEQLVLCLRWGRWWIECPWRIHWTTFVRGYQCRYHRQGHQRHIATYEHIVVKVSQPTRAKSLSSILSNYTYLKELWEWAVKNCSDTEMKARIWGVDFYMRTFECFLRLFGGSLSYLIVITWVKLFKTQHCRLYRVKIVPGWLSKCWKSWEARKISIFFGRQSTWKQNRWKWKSLNFQENAGLQKSWKIFMAMDLPSKLNMRNQKSFTESTITKRYSFKQPKINRSLQSWKKWPKFYESDFEAFHLSSQLKMFGEDFPKTKDVNFTQTLLYT